MKLSETRRYKQTDEQKKKMAGVYLLLLAAGLLLEVNGLPVEEDTGRT